MVAEVIVIMQPTAKEAKEGKLEDLIAGPTMVVAKDLDSARTQMIIATAEKLKEVDQERIQVIARPFATTSH
jgi:hypothetical protein